MSDKGKQGSYLLFVIISVDICNASFIGQPVKAKGQSPSGVYANFGLVHCHAYYKWVWKPAWIHRSKKILFGACQCDGCNGKSEGIVYLKMQGLARTEISLFVIHTMVFGRQLFGVRLWVLVCQDTLSSRTLLGLWRDMVGWWDWVQNLNWLKQSCDVL